MMMYPSNWNDFVEQFDTEKDCIDYLHLLRWENGTYCPRCKHIHVWKINDIKYKCKECYYQFTIFSNTLLHHTHLKIDQIFLGVWYMANTSSGVRANEFKEIIEVGSNRTALSFLNKIRIAMYNAMPERVDGEIFVDMMRISKNRTLYFASQADSPYQLIIRQQKTNDERTLARFILDYVEEGSVIRLDKKWVSNVSDYLSANAFYGYQIEPIYLGLNPIQRIIEELEESNLLGEKEYSLFTTKNDNYLYECCYKYNRRDEEDGFRFYEILKNLIQTI